MPRLAVLDAATVEAVSVYPGACTATGIRSAKVVSPDDYALCLVLAELDDSATLQWPELHGDEGIHVISGALDVNGRISPAGGAVIVESNVVTAARAMGPTRIAHAMQRNPAVAWAGPYGPPRPDRHGVHVLGPRGWFTSGAREGVQAHWFADSTCETCRIAFFTVRQTTPGRRGPAHSHSQDEIIHVLDGSVMLGKRELGPGTSLCIPADVRYRVTSGPRGHVFLNYRPDAAYQTNDPGEPPLLEGGLARGGVEVRDFR